MRERRTASPAAGPATGGRGTGGPRTGGQLLEVEELSVAFRIDRRWVDVVRSASFSIARGEVLALVGESGSGKTVTSMSLMGLVHHVGGRVTSGRIRFDGRDVTALTEREWRRIRGRRISMIFQQPVRSLDPAFTVGDQIGEALRAHRRMSRRDARAQAVALLDRVHIPHAARRADDYPHMFSGGMCQRVMIAIALSCEPELLIADEPTTALDVTVQAKILELLDEVRADTGISVLYVSHDLGVVAEIADRITVMYAGETIESGSTTAVFRRPRHPYTEGLLASIAGPGPTGRFVGIQGTVPSADAMPAGCRFHPRCQYAVVGVCTDQPMVLHAAGHGQATRCVRAGELSLRGVGDGAPRS